MYLLKPSERDSLWAEYERSLDTKPDSTKRAYLGVLRGFLAYFHLPADSHEAADFVINLKPKQITEYLAALKEKIMPDGTPCSDATYVHRFYALKSFYYFLAGRKYITENPFDSLASPTRRGRQKRPTKCVTTNTVHWVIRRRVAADTIESFELAVLYTLSFFAALRRNEALNLKIGDVTVEQGTLCIFLRSTKAQRSASIPLARDAAAILSQYLSFRKSQGAKADDKIFQQTESTYYRAFKADFGCGPHSARATAITQALSLGDLNQAKEFSRLSSFQAVEIYDKRRKNLLANISLKLKY